MKNSIIEIQEFLISQEIEIDNNLENKNDKNDFKFLIPIQENNEEEEKEDEKQTDQIVQIFQEELYENSDSKT